MRRSVQYRYEANIEELREALDIWEPQDQTTPFSYGGENKTILFLLDKISELECRLADLEEQVDNAGGGS